MEEKYDQDANAFTLKGVSTLAFVRSVYDGDTIRCIFGLDNLYEGKQHIWSCRVVGIDTPELRGAGKNEKAWGIRARDRMRELVLNKEVKLEIEGYDKYGRLLAVPFLWNGKKWINVGEMLVNEGLAVLYSGKGAKMKWERSSPEELLAGRGSDSDGTESDDPVDSGYADNDKEKKASKSKKNKQ